MIEVFRYQIMDADGELREMPDMVTGARVVELKAIAIVGSELKVPQDSVSKEGHYFAVIGAI